jgi:hypothetical protein
MSVDMVGIEAGDDVVGREVAVDEVQGALQVAAGPRELLLRYVITKWQTLYPPDH